MSAQQQALIMDTIVAIRKALKRKAYDSDSDSSVEHNTNRGYKLKKRARFVKQGTLASAMSPAAYKEVAEHAGYQRAIINRNPPLIDDEGYEIDSEDDEERVQEAVATAAEENPYSSVRLEQILAPLTAITDLPNHPTLSRPFTSKALTELATQGRGLMHKENAALWKVKPLLTRLVGDNTWAPCGMMIQPDDELLFTDTNRFLKRPTVPSTSFGIATRNVNGESSKSAASINGISEVAPRAASLQRPSINGGSAAQVEEANGANGDKNSDSEQGKGKEKEMVDGHESPKDETADKDDDDGQGRNRNGRPDGQPEEKPREHSEKDAQVNGNALPPEDGVDGDQGPAITKDVVRNEEVEMAETSEPPDTGKAVEAISQLNGSGAMSVHADSLDDMFIHPLFLAPRAAHPNRDLGLPEQEAEDVRRLLQLYVQKQEEVCRGTKRLYEGLLKADRYRKTVWQWAKAEAHCGPNRDMSDGEDWYDKEEWGLTEDLKKGEDEVEEDTTQTQKKTRNRR
ncbi:hypothetical protein QBC46DRAFT_391553 [Diplogelasinospora grovesii]|uniref:Transcriptional regulatory protein RXT2 N-terminal domain-containing protein n=1 Tax=Diplogelasinospora grovesii TaxID=303347 RepID=A0AAN6N318_9PEZI|nr:hypothetical protein QBC46DRAFT_391553 [Diplogelasinospora grovesii]